MDFKNVIQKLKKRLFLRNLSKNSLGVVLPWKGMNTQFDIPSLFKFSINHENWRKREKLIIKNVSLFLITWQGCRTSLN